MNIYKNRINSLCSWMMTEKIDAVVIEDSETRRTQNLRYLTGMDSDAVLVIFADGESVLIPWDIILAEKTATANKIIAFTEFDRNYVTAATAVCSEKLKGGRIELAASTPYVIYNEIAAGLKGFELVCRAAGSDDYLLRTRAVKDETEIEIYKRAGQMTDKLIDSIEAGFRNGTIKTEIDAAMLIEAESRRLGAEGSSFETLAAGPSRSWGIHCIPAYSAGPIGGQAEDGSGGLSILDCGLKLEGYATDITMTICRGELSDKQQQMIELVAGAHALAAVAASKSGVSGAGVARVVDEYFAAAGWTMPHGLGHGIGLDVHEQPVLKNNELFELPLLPGMVFTIEPGLYDAEAGGVRLENDYLMTETGAVAITSSRILMLQ